MPDIPRKGRGAVSNRSGRFEPTVRERIDDGWTAAEEDPAPLRTTVTAEHPKTIIARNRSPDVPFDRSINPYRGCEHGCVYCFARPSHAYMGLSAGLDFESRLFSKPNAAELLERELRKPGYRPAVIQLGANTDPYQPVERRLGITRRVLEVLAAFDHPVSVLTKSDLVLRDLDILAPMAARGLAVVGVSVTTLDGRLARTLEPRAPRPGKRIDAVRRLAEAGVPTAVMAAPMIPFVNDHEIERIAEAASAAGAEALDYILLRLPLEIAGLFEEWLATHRPDRAERVLNALRGARHGRLNVARFGERMRGDGPLAGMIRQRFDLARRKRNLRPLRGSEFALRTDLFGRPPAAGDQLSLF